LNQLKTVILLGGLSLLLVGVGALMGGANNIMLFGAIAVGINFFSYFYSHKIVLRINKAHPVQPHEAPELHAMVQEVAQRAGIPKPAVYIMDDDSPNAFATGRNPKHGVVAVTRGIMRILSPRELKGVIAHEMARGGHSRISRPLKFKVGEVVVRFTRSAARHTQKNRSTVCTLFENKRLAA